MRSAGQSDGFELGAILADRQRLPDAGAAVFQSTGTSPLGEVSAMTGVGPGRTKRATSIATSSLARRTASQPRSDQEE